MLLKYSLRSPFDISSKTIISCVGRRSIRIIAKQLDVLRLPAFSVNDCLHWTSTMAGKKHVTEYNMYIHYCLCVQSSLVNMHQHMILLLLSACAEQSNRWLYNRQTYTMSCVVHYTTCAHCSTEIPPCGWLYWECIIFSTFTSIVVSHYLVADSKITHHLVTYYLFVSTVPN